MANIMDATTIQNEVNYKSLIISQARAFWDPYNTGGKENLDVIITKNRTENGNEFVGRVIVYWRAQKVGRGNKYSVMMETSKTNSVLLAYKTLLDRLREKLVAHEANMDRANAVVEKALEPGM
ncbi:hypothetical protein BDV96DRAFT_641499 [Lophiotrema nucula]|uniref:Uncharacterized protein n=1 Tax=Lophiotrema nucula TaxID=690887 RepID=A0A6A5ZPR7_9PLEO|nr:hypothetical protein BDV96DRAFT_641499 [Lophiotrema nucula]